MAVDSYKTFALGTECTLLGYGETPSKDAFQIFTFLINEMDSAASRFRSDSELRTTFNGEALREVEVSQILFDALEAAIYGARVTGGYLDPTVEGSLVALGYTADFATTLSSESPRRDQTRIVLPLGYQNIILNRAARTVSVSKGVTLDLGSTGKAFLADRIRKRIETELAEPVLVNLGGDISATTLEQEPFWPINITDDRSLDPSSAGMLTSIAGGGVATSSTLRRAWKNGSERVHHLINPFSGQSARPVFDTVTVFAGSALDANIASSGTIVMGPRGLAWLESTGLPAIARSNEQGTKYFGNFKQPETTQSRR